MWTQPDGASTGCVCREEAGKAESRESWARCQQALALAAFRERRGLVGECTGKGEVQQHQGKEQPHHGCESPAGIAGCEELAQLPPSSLSPSGSSPDPPAWPGAPTWTGGSASSTRTQQCENPASTKTACANTACARRERTKCGETCLRTHHSSLAEETKSAAQMEQSTEDFSSISHQFLSVIVKIVY